MKATIEFDLNDADDKAKHKLFTHIDAMTLTLWDFDDYLTRIIKYDEQRSEEYKQAFRDARECLYEMLMDNGLSIDLMK